VILRVLEVTDCIGDDGADSANCIFLPNFEASFQFLTIDHYVIVDVEEDCLLAFLGDFVAPVHGVTGGLVEIDWPFPGVPF
jgi:hypothetical protein